MARYDYIGHTSRNGSSARARVDRVGYSYRALGENVAGGQHSVDTVLQGWLDSPGHCKNLMSPDFREVAVAYATNKQSRYQIFWAQVLATRL